MRFSTLTAWAVLGGSLYALYSVLKPQGSFMSPAIRRRLPLAKKLNTIEDWSGNYDIDGVSFDTNGVVVSGDAHKTHHVTPPATVIENKPSESQLH